VASGPADAQAASPATVFALAHEASFGGQALNQPAGEQLGVG
jgi:hypothetical protein